MARSLAVAFSALDDSSLVVDRVYEGGTSGTFADDPLALLLPVGNQGGFRYKGSPKQRAVRLVALYTTSTEPDWPDSLDPQTGIFTYYGDNRSPGRDLHDTQRDGNLLLRDVFSQTHGSEQDRAAVPPFLLFEKSAPGRRIVFRGLLAPGAATLTPDDELAAVWRSSNGSRFQNYRARFTVLDVAEVTREWLDDILAGKANDSRHRPSAWASWVHGRTYQPLLAPSTTVVRKKAEQLPQDTGGHSILREIRKFYRGNEHGFEACAVQLWRLLAPRTTRCDVTQPSRDGGRDAIGEYTLGPPSDPITIDFALEAKCYSDTTSVGVRDVSRLIARLRHRQFGVFVTLTGRHTQKSARTPIRLC
ncbi:restriction endonuclease [Amycolatopsis sp. NPDC049252]|uniref:restriction endonuclease n=1 Tax=Amycolatopsis sp. NPDC049252 TaxID=3363933 RepID=UPI0037170538